MECHDQPQHALADNGSQHEALEVKLKADSMSNVTTASSCSRYSLLHTGTMLGAKADPHR